MNTKNHFLSMIHPAFDFILLEKIHKKDLMTLFLSGDNLYCLFFKLIRVPLLLSNNWFIEVGGIT